MEYTINKLSKLASISSRTLRYYDEIGLLKPLKINSSGYRVYGENELKRLQQILFLRQFGLELTTISKILDSDSFNTIQMLKSHLLLLKQQRNEIDSIINNVEKTIENEKGKIVLKDFERFVGLQKKFLVNNFLEYQNELMNLYSPSQLKLYSETAANMSFDELTSLNALEKYIIYNLEKFVKTHEQIPSFLAEDIYSHHKEWLNFMLTPLTPEIHLSIAEQYVNDSRFKSYYDKHVDGCAKSLFDIVSYYTKELLV